MDPTKARIYGTDGSSKDIQILVDAEGKIQVTIEEPDIATETTLTTVLSALNSINGKVATQTTLVAVQNLLSTINGKVATEATLAAIQAILAADLQPVNVPTHGATTSLVAGVPQVLASKQVFTGESVKGMVVSSNRECIFRLKRQSVTIAVARTTSDSPTTSLIIDGGLVVSSGDVFDIEAENESDQGTAAAEATLLTA